MSDVPVKFYPLADEWTKDEVTRIAQTWAKGTGSLFNTGSNAGFAIGAVAEYLANQRGVTLSQQRTGDAEASEWLANELRKNNQ